MKERKKDGKATMELSASERMTCRSEKRKAESTSAEVDVGRLSMIKSPGGKYLRGLDCRMSSYIGNDGNIIRF